jgi:hypothetical protein
MAVALLFHRLFMGEVIFWGVPAIQFYSWLKFAFDGLRQGTIPFWNPYSGFGAPLLANYQSAVLYPPNWLYLLIPAEYAMGWIGVAHVIWGGIGMRAYLRRLQVGAFGQGVGMLAFCLSGSVIGRFGFLSITSAVAWLPWLLWAIDGVVSLQPEPLPLRQRLVLLTLISAMQLLAGHAQSTAYSLVLAALYGFWRLASLPARRWERPLLAYGATGAVILGFEVAMAQLLPTYELMAWSQRAGGVDREFGLAYSFWPWRFLTLLIPNLFGSPATGNYAGYGAYWEDAIYVGLLPLVMSGHALMRFLRERREGTLSAAGQVVPFYLLALPFVFVLALGKNTPIFPWLFDRILLFAVFQAPTRWMLLAVFAFSVLGGIGADGWRSSFWGLFFTRLATAGGAAVLATIYIVVRFVKLPIRFEYIQPLVIAGALVVALGALSQILPVVEKRPHWRVGWEVAILALLSTDLLMAHWMLAPTIEAAYYSTHSKLAESVRSTAPGTRIYYSPAEEQKARTEEFLDFADFNADDIAHWRSMWDAFTPDLNMVDGIASANNFDPLIIGPYRAMMQSLKQDKAGAIDQVRLLQEINVGTLMTLSPRSHLTLIGQAGPVYAYHIPDAWPRAVLAECPPDPDQKCRRLQSGTVEIVLDQPNRIRLTLHTSQATTLLLLDTYYPGWEATVDGKPVEIRRVHRAFRGVEVQAGDHTVEWTYFPRTFVTGAALSVISLILVIAVWVGVPGVKSA